MEPCNFCLPIVSVEPESSDGHDDKLLIPVYSSGFSEINPLVIVSVQCRIDITWFPFDDQFCKLAYESWSYPSSMLNITEFEGENVLGALEPNCEWEIKGDNVTISFWKICKTFSYCVTL